MRPGQSSVLRSQLFVIGLPFSGASPLPGALRRARDARRTTQNYPSRHRQRFAHFGRRAGPPSAL